MSKRLVACAAALFSLALAPGCGREGPEYAPVEGTVTLDGKPLAGVEVCFGPDPAAHPLGGTSACYTDAAGRYTLWCESAGRAGALVGPHRVCVHDIAAMPPPPGHPLEAEWRARPHGLRVPQRYSDARRTPFPVIEVRPGPQSHDFQLTSKPR